MILWELFRVFFLIGLFSYGGGYAILSLMQREVETRGWMDAERFVDMIAIAQSTPGPIAINVATFCGYERFGLLGAFVGTLAVMLPGLMLIVTLSRVVFHFYERPWATSVFYGLRPAVTGLILAAVWQVARIALWHDASSQQLDVRPVGLIIALVSVVLIVRYQLNPVWLVLGAAGVGMLLL